MPDIIEGSIKQFDWIKFSIIFIVWIVGCWIIIDLNNKVKEETSAMFDSQNYVNMMRKEEMKSEESED